MTKWIEGLTHKDWLFDGAHIRGSIMMAKFANLDWSNAWVDMGPSIAGNPGPYWHVPLKKTILDGDVYACGDTVHRLYPKVLMTKWLPLIQQACKEVAERYDPENLRKKCDDLTIELAVTKSKIAAFERLSPASECKLEG